MPQTLYDTLGIDKDATADQIKQAYWDRARKTHPDHSPGHEDEFNDAAIAYQVLSIPQRRKDYDEIGFVNTMTENETIKQEAYSRISEIFMAVVERLGPDIYTIDIISSIRNKSESAYKQLAAEADQAMKSITQWDKIRKRISFSGDGANIMANVCDKQIEGLSAKIEMVQHQIKVAEKIKEVLVDYDWEFTARDSGAFGHVGATSPLGRAIIPGV